MVKNAGNILAIDAGTGSGRAVLFDVRGNQVAVGQEEWTHKSDPRYPDSMEFDVIHNWELLCRCIRHARSPAQRSPRGAFPRLLWVKNFMPEAYQKIAKISMLSDWVLFRLCGEVATDPSNGGTSGIYSLTDRDWVQI